MADSIQGSTRHRDRQTVRIEEMGEIDDEFKFQFRWMRGLCSQFTKKEIDKNIDVLGQEEFYLGYNKFEIWN